MKTIKKFWLNSDGIQKLLTMNPMEKVNRENKPASVNISYLFEETNCLCHNVKLNPLTNRKGKYISETMYRNIKEIIIQD